MPWESLHKWDIVSIENNIEVKYEVLSFCDQQWHKKV